jgi:hypothetical protein
MIVAADKLTQRSSDATKHIARTVSATSRAATLLLLLLPDSCCIHPHKMTLLHIRGIGLRLGLLSALQLLLLLLLVLLYHY